MLFELGRTVITTNAEGKLDPLSVQKALNRYIKGDWGDIPDEDRKANEDALRHGDRLMGVYKDVNGVKFWVITEWDRSVTTVLLPEDY